MLATERAPAAPGCVYPSPGSSPTPDNIFAGSGNKCLVALPSYSAPSQTSNLPSGFPAYTGYAILQYDTEANPTRQIGISVANDISAVSITTNAGTPQSDAYGVWSDGTGAIIDLTGSPNNTVIVTILTEGSGASGSGSAGVFASGGGTVRLAGGSVTTQADSAPGLYATGGGTISTSAGMTVSTSGSSAYGAEADTGGAVSLTGGKITTSGAGADGLYANDGEITTNLLNGAGTTVSTTGTNAIGAQASAGGVLILNGGSVTTSGAGSVGVEALTGGSATLGGVSIMTSGQDAHALAVAGAGSQASLTGSNAFVTQGNGAVGLYATQGGVFTATGATTVSTSGGVSSATGLGAYGVNADGAGSKVSLASATIKTSGAGAFALLASDATNSGAAGSISVSGPLSVTTTNPAATAIGLKGDGASIVASGGGTIASAGGAIAFLGGTNQTATFDNVTIANQTGDLIFADPSVATINFNGVTANAGTNNLLNATNGSFVTLNAASSTLTGAITDRRHIDLDGQPDQRLDLDHDRFLRPDQPGGRQQLRRVSRRPPAGVGFKTLTLSNYVGSGGLRDDERHARRNRVSFGRDRHQRRQGHRIDAVDHSQHRRLGRADDRRRHSGHRRGQRRNHRPERVRPRQYAGRRRLCLHAGAERAGPLPRLRADHDARAGGDLDHQRRRRRSSRRSSPAGCSARSCSGRPNRSVARIAVPASDRSAPTRSARTAARA